MRRSALSHHSHTYGVRRRHTEQSVPHGLVESCGPMNASDDDTLRSEQGESLVDFFVLISRRDPMLIKEIMRFLHSTDAQRARGAEALTDV